LKKSLDSYTHKPAVADSEMLYRGVHKSQWDFSKNRPKSSLFKDSKGTSVDRSNGRAKKDCVDFLLKNKPFFAICNVLTKDVRALNAVVLYLPIDKINPFHCEIHDSIGKPRIGGKKAGNIRDHSKPVYPESISSQKIP
jgi:hypothetical protein